MTRRIWTRAGDIINSAKEVIVCFCWHLSVCLCSIIICDEWILMTFSGNVGNVVTSNIWFGWGGCFGCKPQFVLIWAAWWRCALSQCFFSLIMPNNTHLLFKSYGRSNTKAISSWWRCWRQNQDMCSDTRLLMSEHAVSVVWYRRLGQSNQKQVVFSLFHFLSKSQACFQFVVLMFRYDLMTFMLNKPQNRASINVSIILALIFRRLQWNTPKLPAVPGKNTEL